LCGETDFGEPQKDEAENGDGVFLGFQTAIGAKLIGGSPKTFLQRLVGRILFRWRNPMHKFSDAGNGGEASQRWFEDFLSPYQISPGILVQPAAAARNIAIV
jgi:hypothetical protein